MTTQRQSLVTPHIGNALMYVANHYPTLYDVLMEVVQNAIDEDAKHINLLLDRKRKRVVVTDDGNGASIEMFDAALSSVCQSMKARDKLGQFGIGLIAPLGKCRSFTFTSCPSNGANGFCEWDFVSKDIAGQHENVRIPNRMIPDMVYGKTAKTVRTSKGKKRTVDWRTKVTINEFSKDRTINRIASIDALVDGVIERFAVPMRRKKVVLSVKFVNEDGTDVSREIKVDNLYNGIPLDRVLYEEEDAGTTEFRLFLSPQTTRGYEGKVVMGERDNDFRFGFQYFTRNAREYCSNEALDALRSGIFEGEILSSRAQLNPNRTSFMINDAFVGFCNAINKWYEEHGKAYMNAVREAETEVRYQELGLTSLRTIEQMLKSPQFKAFAELLEMFKQGRAKDADNLDQSKVVNIQDHPSILTTPEREKVDRARRKIRPGNQRRPFSVMGPRGSRQTLVRSEALGLQFSHMVMAESNRLWELDEVRGILHFNIRHPIWVECDNSDRMILQLQEFVALQALRIFATPDNLKEIMRADSDDLTKQYVFLIKHSAAFNPRTKLRTSTIAE